jgi:hypothetical protein
MLDIPQTKIYQNTKKAYNYQTNSALSVAESHNSLFSKGNK